MFYDGARLVFYPSTYAYLAVVFNRSTRVRLGPGAQGAGAVYCYGYFYFRSRLQCAAAIAYQCSFALPAAGGWVEPFGTRQPQPWRHGGRGEGLLRALPFSFALLALLCPSLPVQVRWGHRCA